MSFAAFPLRAVALAGSLGLLAACVPPPGPTGSSQVVIDPADSCGPQVVVFVSAGDLFGEPPRRAAPPTAAELEAELARENVALERLQISFDALLYCRWTEVRVIRSEAEAGTIPPAEGARRLAAAEGRLRRDVSQGGQIRDNITARSARIEAAVERVSPGTRAAVAAARATSTALPRAVASAPLVLRLRPDNVSPIVARLPAGAQATLRPGAGGFSFADAGPQARGYGPSSAFTVVPQVQVTSGAPGTDRLRTLAATNIARRESFSQSIALADRSNLQQRFEPAS
ncbi:hypothetical protein [Roseococcus sp.]|uniref:hypothetical protein n=1 Tax=Roseococcus sp. TaxID=2109646 RepID=UPI003BAD885C